MCSVWQPYGDKAGGGEVGGGGHPQVGGGGIGESAGGGGRENTTREGIDKALDQDYVFLFSDQVCYQVAKLSTRGEYLHIVEISTHLLKTGEIYIHFWTMSKRKMLFFKMASLMAEGLFSTGLPRLVYTFLRKTQQKIGTF